MNSNGGDSHRLDALAGALDKAGLPFGELDETWRGRVRCLAKYSPGFGARCADSPETLRAWIEGGLEERKRVPQLLAELSDGLDSAPDPEMELRRRHRLELIRIAWRDLCGLSSISRVTRELSDLAEAAVRVVYQRHWDAMTAKWGRPQSAEGGGPAGFAIIALGKLGGRELNFSSDIDLMFVYDHPGETDGETKLANNDFFIQLSQRVCETLTKPTAEGFMYRVDTRIRPEGSSGSMAASLMAVEIYYHTYGQNWERQALLKARPIAGGAELGKRFMGLVTPFTYRKYVDEVEMGDVLRGIDHLRNRSLKEIGPPAKQAENFKNGYGGIRDIEFFVQAVQLLYGGQYPEIKLTGTLMSLRRMHESHLLHSRDYEFLSEAYRFLRKVEHRLQMMNNRQVYELPSGAEGRSLLAESMGFDSYSEFRALYDEITRRVREIYQGVFKRREWESPEEIILESASYAPEAEELLRLYEFDDPRQAFNFLKSLQKSGDLHLQTKTERLFKAILPRLLVYLKNSPDPGMALGNFERIVNAYKAKTALYQVLCDQPPLLDLLVSVTSNSSFLTSLILRDPSLMETLGREGVLRETVSDDYLPRHFEVIRQAHPREDLQSHLLRVQNAAMFQSGVRFVLGVTDVEAMARELAGIADFILERSMEAANETLAARFPDFARDHGGEIAVIGMGKLGGEEFNVASDCDIVPVFREPRVTAETSSGEYFHRWASRYIEFLQHKSRLGFLYNVDARLRPHGGNAPLACGLKTLAEYYRGNAQFWEKMALTRARFVCGDDTARRFLDELKEEILFSAPPGADDLQSLLDMRRKIEREKSGETLKAAPGGLIDVEFVAQALALIHGHASPAMRKTATLDILRAARDGGFLEPDAADTLIESYRLLREIENRLRIVNNVSIDRLPGGGELEKLARRYNLKLDARPVTPDGLLQTIGAATRSVRRVFNDFFRSVCPGCRIGD